MQFGNPQVLWLLLLWPVVVWLGWLTLAWRRRLAARIGPAPLLERLYPTSVRRWRRRRFVLTALALLLLIVAAARPQYGQVVQTIRAVGTNVIIAVDCSGSMKAQDVKPNRLEEAKSSLDLLLRRLGGNRVGIVAFAGEAFLQCPMTLDREMASLVLKSLDTDSVGVPGTDIGQAIRVATDAFEHGAGDEGGRALVLLTDGEDNEGKAAVAARAAAEKHIHIYGIGIGTERGALLHDERGGFKADSSGAKVNSQMRMDTLKEIAKATGGTAYEAGVAPAGAVNDVASQILKLGKTEMENRRQILYQDRFQWFLAPALLLLVWAMLLRPEPVRLAHTRSVTTPTPAKPVSEPV